MRTFKEAKTGRWYVDYFFQGRRVRYPAGDTKREADQLKSRITLEINAGTHDPAQTKRVVQGRDDASVSFDDLVKKFLLEYKPRSGRNDYYKEQSEVWLKYFEGKRVADITSAEVVRMLHSRLEDISASTARKELVSLSTLFRWAKRAGLASNNPADADNVERPREMFNPQEIRWLTDDELTNLKGSSPVWLRAVIIWAAETGMDRGKIRSLRWQELDLERFQGRVVAGRFAMQRDKTGKPVRQELTDGAMEALNLASRTRHKDGTVFLNPLGQPIQEKALEWAIKKAYNAVEIKGCNFRTFRHTFATRALRRGVPREVVAMMMGHSTAFMTERYMHVADDQLRAAAQALNGPERLGGSQMAVTPGEAANGNQPAPQHKVSRS